MGISQLYQGLTFLAYATGIIIILVGIMLIKVLFDISKLTNNINETTTIVKKELTPTLENVNKSVAIISGIVIKTDESINKVKVFIAKSPLKILSKLSTMSGSIAKGFFGGLCAGMKLFGKKK